MVMKSKNNHAHAHSHQHQNNRKVSHNFLPRKKTMGILVSFIFALLASVFSLCYLHESIMKFEKKALSKKSYYEESQSRLSYSSSSVKSKLEFPLQQMTIHQEDDDESAYKSISSSAAEQRSSISIDILSIGSNTRIGNIESQRGTMTSHVNVRHFFNVTEDDDVDRRCHVDLQSGDIEKIRHFCHIRDLEDTGKYFAPRNFMKQKSNPVGWLCAQTRPAIGLVKVIRQYCNSDTTTSIPDWLVVLDDDSFLNVELFVQKMTITMMSDSTRKILLTKPMAGCVLERFPFAIPHGGFGLFLPKPVLQRLLQPLPNYNNNKNLVQVIYEYATEQPFSQYRNWTGGYCLHSDWLWGYFFRKQQLHNSNNNQYHLPLQNSGMVPYYSDDELYKIRNTTSKRHPCRHSEEDKCNLNIAHICHYINSTHMKQLGNEMQRRYPNNHD